MVQANDIALGIAIIALFLIFYLSRFGKTTPASASHKVLASNLPIFVGSTQCRKCGSGLCDKVRHCDGCEHVLGEHLHRECWRCKARWMEQVAGRIS